MNTMNCPCHICGSESHSYSSKCQASYFMCNSCHTIFQYPFPTLQEMMNFANKEYKDGIYKEYLEANDLKYATFEYRLKKVIKEFNSQKRLDSLPRILDVGCSNGRFIEVALKNGYDAWGVEFSESAIAAASPNVKAKIYHGDANDIDKLGIKKFNIITAFDLIEHLFDPITFLNDLRKLLTKDGLIVMSTPDASSFPRKIMGKNWSMLQPFQHTILLSQKGCRIMLQKAKYDRITISGTKKVFTPDYLFGQLKGINPSLYKIYESFKRILPCYVREKQIQMNIGEMMFSASPREK